MQTILHTECLIEQKVQKRTFHLLLCEFTVLHPHGEVVVERPRHERRHLIDDAESVRAVKLGVGQRVIGS